MNKSTTLWILATCVVVIGVIIYIVKGISNETSDNSSSNSNTETYESISSSNSQRSTNTLNRNSFSEPIVEKPIPKESEYRGNQLQNGASPLNSCFEKGINNGNATLTVKNGSSSDAIVLLFSSSRDRTIRNVYVRKNTNFTIKNIERGNYKIRIFYGNDWNPTIENPCGKIGYFESDTIVSEFDQQNFFEDNDKSYTVATLTLYPVIGGNASSHEISEAELFSK